MHAAQEDQHREGHDEGVEPEPDDQEAVDGADEGAGDEARRHRRVAARSPKPEPPKVASLERSARRPASAPRPTTDSSDRSNLPAIRISDSAITRTDSSEDCCRMLRKLSVVRKASLTSAAGDDREHDRRQQRQLAQAEADARRRSSAPAGPRRPRRRRSRSRSSTPSIAATRSSSCQPAPNSADEPALEDHQHAVADRQLVQVVGDDQHRRAGRARVARRCANSAALEAMSTPCVGYGEHQHLGRGGERPAHHRLLLVAAAELADRLLGRRGHDLRAGDQAAGLRGRAPPAARCPAGPSRSTMVMRQVLGDRELRDDAAPRGGRAARSRRPSAAPPATPPGAQRRAGDAGSRRRWA